eukprot:9466198-Pyramimonas_sp.AAC.1
MRPDRQRFICNAAACPKCGSLVHRASCDSRVARCPGVIALRRPAAAAAPLPSPASVIRRRLREKQVVEAPRRTRMRSKSASTIYPPPPVPVAPVLIQEAPPPAPVKNRRKLQQAQAKAKRAPRKTESKTGYSSTCRNCGQLASYANHIYACAKAPWDVWLKG